MITYKFRASVIGCNGFLGKHLCLFLKKENWDVFGYDTAKNSLLQIEQYSQVDLIEKTQVVRIKTDVDFIFFFSGITGTSKGFEEYEKYIHVNEIGLLNILNLAHQHKSKARFVFPSTRLVYKGIQNKSLSEESEKEFKSIYSLNKWFGEQVIQQFNSCFGINFNIFRIGVPYGNLFSGDYSYGTIGAFLKQAMAKKNIVLYGSGTQKRTFTYVDDTIMQIYMTILHHTSENQIFNIEGETFSVKEVAQQIAEKFGVFVEHMEWPSMDLKLESGDTIFECSKIQQFTIGRPKHSFDNWLNNLGKI